MEEIIRELLTPNGAAKLRKRQEEVFPIPEPGKRVEKRILDFIERLVGKDE